MYVIGNITGVRGDMVTVEVNGWGLDCYCLARDNLSLNQGHRLYLHESLRLGQSGELVRSYFAFISPIDLEIFLFLLGVRGIGTRLALGILSNPGPALIAALNSRQGLGRLDHVTPRLEQAILSALGVRGFGFGSGKYDPEYMTIYGNLLSLGFSGKDISDALESMDIRGIPEGEAMMGAIALIHARKTNPG